MDYEELDAKVRDLATQNKQMELREIYTAIQLGEFRHIPHKNLAKIKLFIIDWFDR